jgi:hypothetical protein
VFKNKVLRRIFGPKRDELMGGWREVRDLYSSPCIIRIGWEAGENCIMRRFVICTLCQV